MKASIVGATGYSGLELIRLLHNHPNVEIHSVVSGSSKGAAISEIYPHLTGLGIPRLSKLNAEETDVVFYATPSGISNSEVPALLGKEVRIIDLSGDFRLKSPEQYEEWYGKTPAQQEHLDQAVYGLSEFYREKITNSRFIANPGCYPTATLLGITPLLKQGWIESDSIIIDGKSGVSGAGRGLSQNTHYPETNENLSAYKLGRHQHIPEIEQVLSEQASKPVQVTFSTHLVPMTRGIMCTIYAKMAKSFTQDQIEELYRDFYETSPFVRIREGGTYPSTKQVYGSNFCDIGFAVNQRTNQIMVVSVIDNVVKGAAGQAVQNLNLMMGWNETEGLNMTPVFP